MTEIVLGTQGDGSRFSLAVPDLCRNAIVSGTTGFGKSAFLHIVILQLLTGHPEVRIVLADPKGQTAATLRDVLLPALGADYPHLAPNRVLAIEPFGPYAVPLNPFLGEKGLDAELHSYLIAVECDALVQGGLGPRMQAILRKLVRAFLALRGTASFADVLRALSDADFRDRCGRALPDRDLATFLHDFASEPSASVDALRARLEMLLLPPLRYSLCSADAVSPRDLLETGVTIIDLGGAPRGCAALAEYMGAFLWNRVTGAVFSRSSQDGGTSPRCLLIVDEWASMCRGSPEEFESLLTKCRSFNAAIWLCSQGIGSLDVPPPLKSALLTNTLLHIAFNPHGEDLDDVLRDWRGQGDVVNPDRPSQILTRSELRERVEREIAHLPMRHAVVRDDVNRRLAVVRVPTVPLAEAARRAGALPDELRASYRRGAKGCLACALPAAEVQFHDDAQAPVSLFPRPVRAARGRPALELP